MSDEQVRQALALFDVRSDGHAYSVGDVTSVRRIVLYRVVRGIGRRRIGRPTSPARWTPVRETRARPRTYSSSRWVPLAHYSVGDRDVRGCRGSR